MATIYRRTKAPARGVRLGRANLAVVKAEQEVREARAPGARAMAERRLHAARENLNAVRKRGQS